MAEAATNAPAMENAPAATAATTPAAPVGDNASAPVATPLNGSGTSIAAEKPTDWTASLTDDTREVVKQKGWKDVNSAIQSYAELQREFSSRKGLVPPKADAPPEEVDAFFKAIGRPDAPDGYQFGVPEGVPETMPYDQNFALEFKTMAHQAGLTPKQAAAIHNGYVKTMAGQLAAMQEMTNQKITATHGELTKAWGAPETEGYKKSVELARRAITNLDLGSSLKTLGAIDPVTGMVTDTKVALALSRIGAAMYQEDAMYAGPTGNVDNPFSIKTENATRQGVLIQNDPAKAAILIRAAGLNPKEYGL